MIVSVVVARYGVKARLTITELSRLGELTTSLDASALPGLTEMDPEESYLSWTIDIATGAGEADVREVFDFVETDCDLSITPLAIGFVVARVLHGVFYLTDKHSLRSLSWLVGMLCAVGLMVLAALRVA